MTIKYKDIDESQFLTKYLELYNLMILEEQRLNPSEISLMVEFALLPSKFEYQRFGSLAKQKVIDSTSSKGWHLTKLNINNKLYALLDKSFLKRDIDKVIYLPKHFLNALSSYRANNFYEVKVQFQPTPDTIDGSDTNNSDSREDGARA